MEDVGELQRPMEESVLGSGAGRLRDDLPDLGRLAPFDRGVGMEFQRMASAA